MPSHFTVTACSGAARAGVLRTAHGDVPTPCFMPIATVGAVHHVSAGELREMGATMILANTYHLMLRPGSQHVAERGGIQQFMRWDGPLLTDSGGFQVFSLGAKVESRGAKGFVALTDDGVRFRSHLDGSTHELTPERAMDIQRELGSDIAMVLDVCPPQPCAPDALARAVATTTAWAQRSIAHAEATGARSHMRIFGIVQGGADAALRCAHAAAITALPFDGFAIGGVAVGESREEMRRAVEVTVPFLPEDRPRYLMGVGAPDDIVHAVRCGIDMFDCVLPTRDARHGRLYRRISDSPDASVGAGRFQISNSAPWYETINIRNERWKGIDEPIDPTCACLTCRNHTLAYLRHLAAIGEPLGQRLATVHNLTFYLGCMRELRAQIMVG